MDLDGLDAAASTLEGAAAAVGDALTLGLDDVRTIVESWMGDPGQFMSARTDAMLTVIQRHLDQVIPATASLVEAGGEVAHVLWANPDKLLDWLDTPLPDSFAAGFYRGFTGNALSCYDVLCLAVAVPSASGSAAVHAMVSTGDYRLAGEILAGIGALVAAATAAADAMRLGFAGTALGAVDILCSVLRSACVLMEKNEYGMLIAGALLLPSMPTVLALIRPISAVTRRRVSLAVTVVFVAIQLGRQSNSTAVWLGVLSILQKLLALGVSELEEPVDPGSLLVGHHESVLRSHRWGTAENSAAYLLPHLRPGAAVLDIGCGPGSLARELADLVGPDRKRSRG